MASLGIQAQIERALVTALQTAVGRIAFADSQMMVPVVTGQLKRSGQYRDTKDGFAIDYFAPYAELVHDGQEASGSEIELYASVVREHDRKLQNGSTVRVKTHTKKYIGMKPTLMLDGNWAVVPTNRSRTPNPFLESALNRRLRTVLGQGGGLDQFLPRVIRIKSLDQESSKWHSKE